MNATDGTMLHLLCEQCYFKLGEQFDDDKLRVGYKKFECRFFCPGGASVTCPRCGHETRFGLTKQGNFGSLSK